MKDVARAQQPLLMHPGSGQEEGIVVPDGWLLGGVDGIHFAGADEEAVGGAGWAAWGRWWDDTWKHCARVADVCPVGHVLGVREARDVERAPALCGCHLGGFLLPVFVAALDNV